jgi:segregation and condensation protein B
LLLAEEPVPASEIGQVLERPTAEVEGLLAELSDDYISDDRGFVLKETSAGWRLYTDPECAPWLERFVRAQTHSRLSGPALEVLAIVAYKQPISRTQISEIRGVDSEKVVKTLLHRGLLLEAGKDSGSGTAIMLTVSDEFLERMGLRTVEELPPLANFMPDSDAVEEMEARLSPNA